MYSRRSIPPIPLITALLMVLAGLVQLVTLCRGMRYFSVPVSFLYLLAFGIYVYFAVVLLLRRRDLLLVVGAAGLCLLNLFSLFASFYSLWSVLGSLLLLLASLGLLAWAACAVLPALAPHQPVTETLWFLPGAVAALGVFLTVAASGRAGSLFSGLLTIAIYFFLGITLVFPSGQLTPTYSGPGDFDPAQPEPVPPEWDGTCDLIKHVLLLLFTFGVWYFIWIYRTTAYLNRVEDEPWRTPVNQLLLCLFVPFYTVFWAYKSAQRLEKLSGTRADDEDLTVLCLLLALFIPFCPPILMQDRMNSLVLGNTPRGPEDLAEQLRVYQKLAEDGLITQEDYGAKKRQLLGL